MKKEVPIDKNRLTQIKMDNKLPKGWEWKKLIDCCSRKDQIVSGPFGSNLKVSDYQSKGVPIIRIQNIGDGYFINKYIKHISHDKAQELDYHSYKPGDLVLAKLGIPIGKTCFIPKDFPAGIIVADVVRIRPNENDIDYSFLKYYLNSDLSVSQLVDNISGATRPRVNLNHVRDIQVPLPPLSEQKRIVAILEEAFAAIDKAKANAEKNLGNAKELFESYLNGIFSNPGEDWEEKNVSQLCESITDCINKTAPTVNYKTPFKMIRTSNIRNGYISLDKVKYVTEEIYTKWTRRQTPKEGDLLFTREAPMGEVGILDEQNTFLGQRIVSYRVNTKIVNNIFLYYYFRSNVIKQQILKMASGATVQHLRVPDTKKFIFYIPNLRIQREIVDLLDEIFTKTKQLESIYQQKITALDELKKTILKKAFEGKL